MARLSDIPYHRLHDTKDAISQAWIRATKHRLLKPVLAIILIANVAAFTIFDYREQISATIVPDRYNPYLEPNPFSNQPSKDEGGEAETLALNPGLDAADAALTDLCHRTNWTEGLWLYCHSGCGPEKASICGGLNNARNRVQTCLRLAISIGAGVVIPQVTARLQKLNNVDASVVCPEIWYDMARLDDQMASLCPRLRIRSCVTNATAENATVVALPHRDYKGPPHFGSTFSELVDGHLSKAGVERANVTAEKPVWLTYNDAHAAWSYRAAGELATIRKALFRTLAYNRTLVDIGNAVADSSQLRDGAYFAVHLRAEYDWPTKWGTPDAQMRLHKEAIERTIADAGNTKPVRTVYVSSGQQEVVETFRAMLAPLNLTVLDKWELLRDRPDQLAVVEGLQWDQQGVVEYSAMVRADYWSGMLVSTMSSMVAYHRVMDEPEEFFGTYIYPDSLKWGLWRTYNESVVLRGNRRTMGIVVNAEELMDAFP